MVMYADIVSLWLVSHVVIYLNVLKHIEICAAVNSN